MPNIACGADWCDKNVNGVCTFEGTIELSWHKYDQFWCHSNIVRGLTEDEREEEHAREMKEWKEREKNK